MNRSMRRAPPLPPYVIAAPPPRRLLHAMTVAFRDCDPMGVLWHGNYLAYCEAARDALGARIGFGIERLIALGWFAPVVRSQVWHHRSLVPGQAITIDVELHATTQPRLYHRFRFLSGETVCADAETEQVLTTRAGVLLLSAPAELIAAFRSH